MDAKTLEMIERMRASEGKQSFEARQEKSTPIQSRIELDTLAELDIYWMREGYQIRTMSQLVAWSVQLLRKILTDNGRLPTQFETLAEAHRYLDMRGLYQPGMRRKGFEKIGTAIAFEGLRKEGVEPKNEAPTQYENMHNERSVKPFMGEIVIDGISTEEWQRIKLRKQQEEYEEHQKKTAKDIEDAKKRGMIAVTEKERQQETHYVVGRPMTVEECEKNERAIEERDRAELAKLNEDPLKQIEEMKKAGMIK